VAVSDARPGLIGRVRPWSRRGQSPISLLDSPTAKPTDPWRALFQYAQAWARAAGCCSPPDTISPVLKGGARQPPELQWCGCTCGREPSPQSHGHLEAVAGQAGRGGRSAGASRHAPARESAGSCCTDSSLLSELRQTYLDRPARTASMTSGGCVLEDAATLGSKARTLIYWQQSSAGSLLGT